MSSNVQKAILQPVPLLSMHLSFRLKPKADKKQAADLLAKIFAACDGKRMVLGLGSKLCEQLSLIAPDALKPFSAPANSKVKLPATQHDIWIWLRSQVTDEAHLEQASLIEATRNLKNHLEPCFKLAEVNSCFRHGKGRDLTGYEDGTENPTGPKAQLAAFAHDGSSFVAVQKWQHRWRKINSMSQHERDQTIGRERETNEELDDAPANAHVKRTAQEQFTLSDNTQGFSLRRSMPWHADGNSGLMFVSFGKNFEAFEAQLKRMSGSYDGITDAVFTMSRPISGAYYWCPPLPIKVI